MSRAVRRMVQKAGAAATWRRFDEHLARVFLETREHVFFADDGTVMMQPIDPVVYAAAYARYVREAPVGDTDCASCPMCRALRDAAVGEPRPLEREEDDTIDDATGEDRDAA